jgi:hypothetical protein
MLGLIGIYLGKLTLFLLSEVEREFLYWRFLYFYFEFQLIKVFIEPTLAELFGVLRTVPKLNQGGCGVAAFVLQSWLNGTIWYEHGKLGHLHYLIKLENKYYDGYGEYIPTLKLSESSIELLEKDLKLDKWNDDFDTRYIKWILKLKK